MSADYDLLIRRCRPRQPGRSTGRRAERRAHRPGRRQPRPPADRSGAMCPRASLPPRAHQMRQRLAGQANVEHFPATRVVACGPAGACCWKTRNVAGRSATDAWSSAPAPANCCCLFPAGPSRRHRRRRPCRRWPRAACHWPASAWWWLAPARCCWPAPPAPASAGRACCASPNRRRREPWPPSPYASALARQAVAGRRPVRP